MRKNGANLIYKKVLKCRTSEPFTRIYAIVIRRGESRKLIRPHDLIASQEQKISGFTRLNKNKHE